MQTKKICKTKSSLQYKKKSKRTNFTPNNKYYITNLNADVEINGEIEK